MKTITLIFSLLIAGTATSFAQCGKHFVLTTSKTEHLDAAGNITRTVDEKATVDINKQNISINVNDQHNMAGTIKSDTCSWPVAYKQGKTVLKAVIDENGEDKNVTITIEGKDGKVTLLCELESEPNDRIRVGVDTFEEKAG